MVDAITKERDENTIPEPCKRNINLRDGVVSQTEDTIEFTKCKRQSGFLGSFTEQLVLDGQIADLEGILGDVTFDRSRTILNAKRRSVLLVSR